ncbi:MAG TPA: UDP-forming cellulose synthase catalytic subunit [Acidobacteriaceae bacterium]
MIESPLWRQLEAGDNVFFWTVRAAILVGGVVFLLLAGVLDLAWPQQALLGLVTLVAAIGMNRASMSYLVTLTLILLSCYSTFRYGWWRLSTVYRFFEGPGAKWTWLDAFFIGLLLMAEAYSFCVLALGYAQTLWPLRRTPAPLPEDTREWPEIDLLIPTYNEPLNVVRYTALAAMNIDWPADKLNVYILDDGKREEFRAFAEEAGIGYMTRDDNEHAKAGNINHALERLDAPFVAVFDSDHVPTRSFFQVTMGWFGRDPKLGLLQTPHHFYSPDPFERNLGQFRTIPNEGELFYGVVQDGNDFWNATFFCGSCAVIRREALDAIGGIATETVTEDAHTSLRMQMHGWNTAYINIPQAAGLATERLSGHVKQRIRWARGMIQILRIDNPLFAPGLTVAQRLCYFNAMMHFLYALPRLIFLTAPLIYLVFKHTNIPGYWAAIFAYALPHLVLSYLTNSRIQGQHRHSFWNEIYETVLAPYIFLPTMLALINPKAGSFHVTAKGGVVNRGFFDARIAQPFIVLLLLNFIGLLCAVPRALQFPLVDAAHPASWVNFAAHMYDGGHPGTIAMNVAWTLFNITVLGVALAVAWESRQRRQTVRVTMAVPAHVVMPDGATVQGVTNDLSSGGVMLLTETPVRLAAGEAIELVFPVLDGDAILPATVVGVDGRTLRAYFDPLTMQEEEALTMVLYSRADTWLGWGEGREADRPLRSMWRILQLSFHGLTHTAMGWRKPAKSKVATSVFSALLAMLLLAGGVQAQVPGTFDKVLTLGDVGTPDAIVLRGVDATHSVYFSLPRTEVVKAATLKLRYHFSPGLLAAVSHLNVSINGTLFATLPVVSSANNGLLESTLAAPPEMLVQDNRLTFEFVGHYTQECEDASNSALWARVDADSSMDLVGSVLPLQNDLKLLPMPFYEKGANLQPAVAVVFMAQPSAKALEAAGIAASWMGILNGDHGVRFPVTVGSTIPAGNAIVIGENAADLPAALGITAGGGPTIAMRTNPDDPYSKVLVLTGDSADDLLVAAKALPLSGGELAGATENVKLPQEARSRRPDDAPRWLSTEKLTTFGELPDRGDLHDVAGAPVDVYFRIPPDLYLNGPAERNLALQLNYRYNGVPLANDSTLQVFMNGAYVSSTPMPHTDKASMDLQTVVPIPRVDMRPFSNSLKTQFVFHTAHNGKCTDAGPANLQGAVLKSSTIDLRGIPHWARMPNLGVNP